VPRYRFTCATCGSEVEQFSSPQIHTIKCTCGNDMKRQLPGKGSQVVKEVVDTYTNTRQVQDQTSELKQRKEDYFWEVEVPRLVQTYSIETCLEEKWLIYNEKGELVINKPPSKR
jgi:DNA-directed RNA polymerase subunit RPC12/RpoP